MKTTSHLLSLFLFTMLALGAQPSALAGDTVSGLLVKWKDGPQSPAAAAGNAQIGSTVKRSFNAVGWQLVKLPPGMKTGDGLKAYRELKSVAAVEPDGQLAIEPPAEKFTEVEPRSVSPRDHVTPDDPNYSSQWYLPRIGAPAAWDVTTGSSNVVVAIIDTGVDYTHPDLAPNMWRNPGETGLDTNGQDRSSNGIDDDANGYVDDVHGADVIHGTGDPMDPGSWNSPTQPQSSATYSGTAIAGLIGAVGNNGVGVAGLNWSVKIMALRLIGGDLSAPDGWQYTDSVFVGCFDYAIVMRRRGVNLRVVNVIGGAYRPSLALQDAIATAGQEGILLVCAAGNSAANNDLFSARPASYGVPSVLSVASTTSSDALRTISNFGATTVDLAAPGENLTTTWRIPSYSSRNGGYSASLVAGAAALLVAFEPELTVDQMKAALLGSVDQPPALRGKVVTHGRLNVARALEYLTNANPTAIVVTALPGGQRTPTDEPIRVTFNRPMDRASVEAAFAITPMVHGTFEWSPDDCSFAFRHDAAFDSSVPAYEVRIAGTARDASGGGLDGDFDQTREGFPADDFVWTFRFQIPNDDFADAQLLTGLSGSIDATNRYAFAEWEEPRELFGNRLDFAYGSSLWYRWTAPQNGWFTFDLTSVTAFDSLLIVYTGDQLDDLVMVAGNDNYGTRAQSRVSFAATPGTNYSIVVAGKNEFDPNLAGAFQLRWYPTPPPAFTGTQFSPASRGPGTQVNLSGTDFTGATSVLFNGASASFEIAPPNQLDLVITTCVPPDAISGPVTVITPHGSVTSTPAFQVLTPTSFAHWATGFGLSGSDAAADGDPDGDGLPSSVEFILGGNPAVPRRVVSLTPATDGGNIVLTFSRIDLSETPEVTLTVETGTDPATWPTIFNIGANSAASSPGVTIVENGASADTISVTIPQADLARLFARLKVTVTP